MAVRRSVRRRLKTVSRIIEFDPERPSSVLERMQAMVEAKHGWVNFEPIVEEADLPPPQSSMLGIFSARGPAIPLCTWVAPTTTRKRTEPMSIGIQHGIGKKALPHLATLGLTVPDGWRTRGDSPKRGVVIEIPTDAPLEEVLDWLLAAGEGLAVGPVSGRWRATLHDG